MIISQRLKTEADIQKDISVKDGSKNIVSPIYQLRTGHSLGAAAAVIPKRFHTVFMTDCKDPTQDWQTSVFFYHAVKSGQPGDVTHIVTGCGTTGGRRQALQATHDTQIKPMGATDGRGDSRFHVHFAPAHPQQEQVNGLRTTMKYFNRPYGVQHWMEETMGYSTTKDSTGEDDTIVVVMDADMIVLRPFTSEFLSQSELWKTTLVQDGQPMAQHDAFASNWWETLESRVLSPAISTGISKMQSMVKSDIDHHFSAGPPFLATARDFYPLVRQWNEVTYPLYEVLNEKIIREPHGPYNLAAATLQKPAQLASSFAVSNFRDAAMTSFDPILNPTALAGGAPGCRQFPQNVKPHVLQYSKRYALGDKFVIGKHYVPLNFIGKPEECQTPLFVEPPDNIGQQVNYYMDPELNLKVQIEKPQHVHQMAFMVCETIQAFNEAAIDFKQKHCKGTANMEKTLIG